MSVITRDPVHRDASSDDDAAAHPHGSFFGRRKGHKLRARQADLIEHLLPRLALEIGNANQPDLTDCSIRRLMSFALKSDSAVASI